MKIYNKLVRDKIPEIIEASGARCETIILNDEQYLAYLDLKLIEEMHEYQESQSLEELADLLEVIYAITLARGYTIPQLDFARSNKAVERGGFRKRILLLAVEEKI